MGGEAARRLIAGLEGIVALRLLDVVSEAALELGAQLPSGTIEVRLAGRDPQLVFVEERGAEAIGGAEEGLPARITLRLPEPLKASIEASAAREGVSVNTWLVRALGRAVTGQPRRQTGSRLTGFAES